MEYEISGGCKGSNTKGMESLLLSHGQLSLPV